MLSYAKMQLEEKSIFSDCHTSLKKVNASDKLSKMIQVNIDEIAMSWIIDKENNIFWHNGGTSHYNSYLGFNPKTKIAVVVLSNLSPLYRIPATILGVKLLKQLSEK